MEVRAVSVSLLDSVCVAGPKDYCSAGVLNAPAQRLWQQLCDCLLAGPYALKFFSFNDGEAASPEMYSIPICWYLLCAWCCDKDAVVSLRAGVVPTFTELVTS